MVGFTTGGPTDLAARYIADLPGERLGQRVVVENRPGAGGHIATQDVLAKARDGYNLLLCTHFEGINLAIYRNAGYRLADITQIARYYYGVVAANDLPATDWEGFVAYARLNPGKLNYGMIGRGSAREILALELAKLSGIRIPACLTRGGVDALNDLIAGRVHFYASPTLAALPQARAGRIKLLAVTSAERLGAAPDVPTLVEKGLPFVRYGWLGLCARAGTAASVITLLNRETGAVVQSPQYRDLVEKAGSTAVSSTPDELAKVLAETYEQTARVAREFDLRL